MHIPKGDLENLKQERDAAKVEAEQSAANARRWEARAKLAQMHVARLVAYVQSISDTASNTQTDIRILLREVDRA